MPLPSCPCREHAAQSNGSRVAINPLCTRQQAAGVCAEGSKRVIAIFYTQGETIIAS